MPGPKWWESKQAYFAYINSKRVRLGTDLLAAQQRFYELSLEALAPTKSERTVAEVVASYLARLKLRNPPNTVRSVTILLRPFVAKFGECQVSQITEEVMTPWLASQGWGPGTRGLTTGYIRTAWRRAKLEPPDFGERERGPRRGKECLISDAQHTALLQFANPAFRDFLIALDETGARPGYIRTVRANEVEHDLWVLPPEDGRKIPETLVVLLSAPMVQLCERLVKEHPTGPIFRDKRGQPWTEQSLRTAWRYCKRKLHLPKPVVMYSYRHRFATRWLLNGGKPAYLVPLQGTSLDMIQRFYAQWLGDIDALRAEHKRVRELANRSARGDNS